MSGTIVARSWGTVAVGLLRHLPRHSLLRPAVADVSPAGSAIRTARGDAIRTRTEIVYQ